MYISITLLEALIILGVFSIIKDSIKKRIIKLGNLGIPILFFSIPTILSTLIYYTKRFNKALEEGLFQILYFLNVKKEDSIHLLGDIPKLFILGFFLLTPVEIYSFYNHGHLKPIWGGTFETGFFYTLFGLTFFILSFTREGRLKVILLIATFFSFLIVILSHRRSMILAFVVLFVIIILVLYRSKFIKKSFFLVILLCFLLTGLTGYIYLSKTDNRFKIFNELILGKRKLDEHTLNRITSSRYALFKEGLQVIKRDISKGNILPLLIGHGVRAKEYLTPHSRIRQPRYESFFIFSEFIERGLLGVIGIIMIYFIYFREILFFRIKENLDFYRLIIIIPLGIHLVQTLFTYFWDAMLPVFLVLFRIYEISKASKS